MGYTAEHGADTEKKKLFMVTGLTTAMHTTFEAMQQWTEQMCELGSGSTVNLMAGLSTPIRNNRINRVLSNHCFTQDAINSKHS